ncbi:aryl sulfotransferase [Burkholderia sp. AU33423]|uniref:aryl-sulfate sulfotransferase n=1 Tax=Burkholderia sp. AU33423 TaxID=2015355 RepID=UPI000B7A4B3D|nr:aryl-sulfate sulfotransferase [Burkholderia sp. AU33423]OXI78937.1 aryl sulfotransferase [Burkholderia sp. AU33423]
METAVTTVDQITQRRRGVGLIAHDPALSAGGYTLIAPQTADGNVYLVGIDGEVAHQWKMPVRPGRHAVILPNGNLGYNGNHPQSESRYAPWSMWHGGDFYEVTPQGETVWRYEDPAHHHDAQWLPNGNLLYAACEPVDAAFARRVPGGTPHGDDEVMYADVIREVNRAGQIVWEWHARDHLRPEDFPIAAGFGRYHWPLVNGLAVDANGRVLMSLRTTSGIIGVNHETGRVDLRIGPDVVSHQHAPVPLPNGNILAFDNGNFRHGAHVVFSRVVEIDPATQRVVWSYADDVVNLFYTPFMGNAQRLPNGNTHVTESSTGRLFEVTPAGEVVWEYVIPWFAEYPDEAARKTGPGQLNSVFQTFRYSAAQLPWLRA